MAWLQADTGHAQTQDHLQVAAEKLKACKDLELPHRYSSHDCKKTRLLQQQAQFILRGFRSPPKQVLSVKGEDAHPRLGSGFAPGFRRETA